MSTDGQAIDYTTHILIGIRGGGLMTVLADWPYVPPQSEVQQQIDRTLEPYVAFVLCTPTSIMAADRAKAPQRAPVGFGLIGPLRRR